jgi:hypothetical protein
MTTRSLRSPWFLYLATLVLAGSAFAQTSDDNLVASGLDDAALESAFWNCDVLATREMLPLSVGIDCVMLTDELKRRRFDGDFSRLLAWWQQHKAAEHAARGAEVDSAEAQARTETSDAP